MKATELRIGNWIHDRFNNKDHQVTGHGISTLERIEKEGDPTIQGCGAIPLTEEWLEKFGFERIEGWEDENMEVPPHWRIVNNHWVNLPVRDGKFFHLGQEIKHIHQLQNLYFSLTGEELTIQTESK